MMMVSSAYWITGKGELLSCRGYVATGYVDEGEGIPEVMRHYQRDLEYDERALEEDSLDDDYDVDYDQSEVHVP
jgi:hypothetical protein